MANIFQIKRRTSGAAGAPGSLANGELAFNEVNNSLYYGKVGSIPAIGGAGDFTTVDTTQTLAGNKTFSSTVVLSSAVAETKVTATSSVAVATTEFVQNVFSVLDGGDFDENGGNITSADFIITGGSWTVLSNWLNPDGTAAVALPTSTNVVELSTNVSVDLDSPSWVQPASIIGNNRWLSLTSQTSASYYISNTTVIGLINYGLSGNAVLAN